MLRNKLRVLLLFLSVMIIAAMLALPTLAKNYIIKHSKSLVGRQIELGQLKYNYFTSTVKAYDFNMLEQGDTASFVSFDTLILNMNLWPLLKNTVSVEQFYLSGLTGKVILQDSTFNFDDLIQFHQKNEEEDTIEKDPIKFNIGNIEFKKINIYFDHKNVNKITHFQDIAFRVPLIAWDQTEKSNADLKFNFKNGGYFESKLNIHPMIGDFDANIILKDLYLDPFYEYVAQQAEINSFNGTLNADIIINGNTNNIVKSIITGKIRIDDFKMTDHQDKLFLSAAAINTRLKKIDYANSTYEIDSLAIDQSYTFFQLDSMSNNFLRIFELGSDTTTKSSEPSSVKYSIDHFSVTNGTLDYTDNLTGDLFNYPLSEINFTSDSIQSTSDWIDIYATMLLNERGTLKANLGIDPGNYLNSTLDISIEDFLLSDLNIYTKYYTGHSIVQGDMFYRSKSRIVDGMVESENKLLIKKASLEHTKGGLYTLPLKFAFFLLTDKDGNVNLDVPVRGDLKDPKISIGKIIWQTFKNVIGKTVAAPVNFLVGLVGGDPKDLEEITFSFTDTIPSEKQYKQLNKLIQLEEKKSGLQIELTYYVDENLQRDAVAMMHAANLFTLETGKDFEKESQRFEKFVTKQIDNDTLPIEEAVLQLTDKTTLDNLINRQTERLMDLTRAYISSEGSWTHILVKKSDPKAPENVGSSPKFLITYGLKEEDN